MKWHALAASAALTIGIVGCDRIPLPFLSQGDSDTTTTAAVDTTLDTATVAQAPPDTQRVAPRQPTTPAPQRQPVQSLVDEPWTPTHTGTVEPGMTRMDVIAVWGEPVAESTAGNRAYLYYRNGCEVTCGTFDLVFLEDDQVVDAIVRGPGHTYAGVSSSPDDRVAEFTPPRPDSEMGDVP